MSGSTLEQLQKEANTINKIYDKINEKKSKSSFYQWCSLHGREDLLEQWDFEKNLMILGITVHTISRSSSIRPYWFCEKHKESYQCRIDAKVKNKQATQCKQCLLEKRRATKAEKVGLLSKWCQENGEYGKQLIREWNITKNKQELDITMESINYNSSKRVYWKCSDCGYEWETSILNRTLNKEGSCPRCLIRRNSEKSQQTILKKRNLRLWCENNGEIGQRLLTEWDTEKNELSMEQITSNYMKKVHWKCENGHEFQVTPYYRTYYKSICPKCSNRSRRGKSLQETHQALLKEWDYSKNEKLPQEYSAWTQERVWWKCPECGHEWRAMISGRAQQATSCPKCHHNWAR